MAINKQEKQLAITYDDLVLVLDIIPADPCPVIDRPTYTFKTQIPGSLISRAPVLADYKVLYGVTSRDLLLYDCPRAQVFPWKVTEARSPVWKAATESSVHSVDLKIPCSASGTWSSVSRNMRCAIIRYYSGKTVNSRLPP